VKNPMATQKKRRLVLYTRIFGGGWLLISSRNPLSQRKNAPNTGGACLLHDRRIATENGREMDALVTVSHLFWPNDRRRTAFSLPISLPISNPLGGKSERENQRGGGGVSQARPGKSPRSKSPHGNFAPKSPLPYSRLKKTRSATAAQFQTISRGSGT
jgi:hypothetical protein